MSMPSERRAFAEGSMILISRPSLRLFKNTWLFLLKLRDNLSNFCF